MEGDDIERPWADDYCVNRDGRLHPAVKAWIVEGLPTMEQLVTSSALIDESVSPNSDATVALRWQARQAIRSASTCLKSMYGTESMFGLVISLDNPTGKANTTTFTETV